MCTQTEYSARGKYTSAKRFTIQPCQLKNGQTYNFTLNVKSLTTNRLSENLALQQIKIVEEISNIVQIKCIRNCRSGFISPNSTFHLKAICITCNGSEKFQWTIDPSITKMPPLTSSRLVIEPNTLVLGLEYKFHVSLRNGIGFSAVKMFTPSGFTVNCSVDPEEGEEACTEFKFTCNKPDRLFTLIQGETPVLSSNDYIFTSKLNANEPVAIKVTDSSGQYSLVAIKVKITERQMLNTVEEFNEIFTSKNDSINLKTMINDKSQSTALVFIRAVAKHLNNLSSEQRVEASDIVSRLVGLMTELRINDFDDISSISNTLKQLLLPIPMNHRLGLKCAKILSKISDQLQNYDEDVDASEYVDSTNNVLSVLNKIIHPFETIPPAQNEDSLISYEYRSEDYKYYGELDFGIFEKLKNLEEITLSIEKTIQGLATCAAKSFQPMEHLHETIAEDIQFKVLPFDNEVARAQRNQLTINTSLVEVTVPNKLLSYFMNEHSIACTFFNKNPMWWFSDGSQINSDVVDVSIYKCSLKQNENVHEITKLPQPIEISLQIKNITQAPRNDSLQSNADMATFKIKCPKNGMIFINFTRLYSNAPVKVYFKNRHLTYNEILNENHSMIVNGPSTNFFRYTCSIHIESLVFMSIVSNEARNSSSRIEEFTFEMNTVQCLYWQRNSSSWMSNGCFVDAELSTFHRINCKCNHLSMFAVKHQKSDFCAVSAENNAPTKSVLWIFISLLLILFSILALWAWRQDQLDANNSKIIYLRSEHTCSRPYTYAITVVTGTSYNANTTSYVAIKIHGDQFTTQILPLFSREVQLFQRGSINIFMIQTTKSIGRIGKITIYHDCYGPYPSWYCEAVIVRDLQRNEEWNFDINQWFLRNTIASVDAISEADYYKKRRLIRLHWTKLLHNSYSLFSMCLRRSDRKMSRLEKVYVLFASIAIGLMVNVLVFTYKQDDGQFIGNILISAAIGLCATYAVRLVIIFLLIKSKTVERNTRRNRHWTLMFKPELRN